MKHVPKLKVSNKWLLINKANASMVIVVAVASFVTVFSLIACRTLLSQRTHQARVIAGKEMAKTQLQANLKAVSSLVAAYQAFAQAPQNVLGGSPTGSGEKDGDNAKLVLDALPSKYDFPALATSLEKLLSDRSFTINGITGSDDEIAQSQTPASATPTPVDIPFGINVSGNYQAVQNLIGVFEHSIRPFQLQQLSLSGNDNSIQLNMTAKTFYQPEKNLDITTKEVQ